tara:strand:+ start:953 stop:1777 length:825 start_codon:yes stop_codon:yes gene_type:complete
MNLEEKTIPYEKAIRTIVKSSIETFSKNFSERHISQKKDTEGVINMKIHNVFVAHLGEEIQYYSALARSFDSSLGNMLEDLAIDIAKLFFTVEKEITGPLYPQQTSKIAELLEAYKNRNNDLKVEVAHYELIKNLNLDTEVVEKTHNSDYYLVDEITKENFIIELKIGGDLDNKKARSEKEALMEQFAILSNTLGENAKIKCYFATAYNRFGEDQPWTQGRVRQFFSEEELLIGKDFWNFICKSELGYKIVLDEYKQNSYLIKESLDKIKEAYL